ncbi:hypothetical protein [Streptomyces pseudoechinosporeus]
MSTGDAMDRYVHHELRSAFAVLAVAACLAVTGIVRGFPPLKADWLWILVVLPLGIAVFTLLKASRLKGVSEVRNFEAAVRVEDTDVVLPTKDFLHNQPVNLGLFAFFLVFLLPMSFWEPWVIVVPVGWALDWLGKAALAAYWERRHGLLVWRGPVPGHPGNLLVSPRQPTRTATDAPPA